MIGARTAARHNIHAHTRWARVDMHARTEDLALAHVFAPPADHNAKLDLVMNALDAVWEDDGRALERPCQRVRGGGGRKAGHSPASWRAHRPGASGHARGARVLPSPGSKIYLTGST